MHGCSRSMLLVGVYRTGRFCYSLSPMCTGGTVPALCLMPVAAPLLFPHAGLCHGKYHQPGLHASPPLRLRAPPCGPSPPATTAIVTELPHQRPHRRGTECPSVREGGSCIQRRGSHTRGGSPSSLSIKRWRPAAGAEPPSTVSRLSPRQGHSDGASAVKPPSPPHLLHISPAASCL